MFWEILLAIFIGVNAGIITGLTPGIHVNLVATILIASAGWLFGLFSPLMIAVIIISTAVTHTFLDSIPSIFLGAPHSDMALGVLPGHRFLLKGEGMTAVRLTVVGSFGAVILSILLFPVFLQIVRLYPLIADHVGYLLIAVVVFMVMRDRSKVMALVVFFLSGTLGLIVLNIPNFSNPLFPLLSGLFGISTLLISLSESSSLPAQKKVQRLELERGATVKALLSGGFSGFITAVMPGLGASTAAVISMQITRKLGEKGFMVLMGSINTFNFILSIATYYMLDKARNGAIIAVRELVGEIEIGHVLLFLAVVLIVGSLGVVLTLTIGRGFSAIVSRVNYRMLISGVIGLIVVLTIVMTGWLGMVILITSTAVGLIPAKAGVTRTHAMGCLLLPVILYFVA